MKIKTKILSLLLALTMLFSMLPAVYAEGVEEAEGDKEQTAIVDDETESTESVGEEETETAPQETETEEAKQEETPDTEEAPKTEETSDTEETPNTEEASEKETESEETTEEPVADSEENKTEDSLNDTDDDDDDLSDLTEEELAALGEIMMMADTVELPYDAFYKMVLIDCGRGYYTVDQIKTIIDKMALCDYEYLMLGFGNDGLRFLLDDMSVYVDGKSYTDSVIRAAIIAKNDELAPSAKGQWSQSDMDTMIAYAKAKGIQIVPMIDVPGHATSITAAMTACGISAAVANRNGSTDSGSTTFDVTNTEAVAFAKALLTKYITYFAGKGASVFNLGMDEYAGNNGGWSSMSSAERAALATFLSDMTTIITNAGMNPMAFCDVIGNISSVPDSVIGINWNGGYLSGHRNVNANYDWYYVLGATGTGWAGYDKAMNYTASTKVTSARAGSSSTQAGCLLAIWNDNYLAADSYIENIENLIESQATNNPSYFTISEPEAPVYEMSDPTNTITINTEATKTPLTAVAMEAASVTGVETDYVAYNVTVNGGEYTGEASVTIPLNAELQSAAHLTGFVVNADGTVTKVSGTKSTDGAKYTFTAPHFSVVGVMALGEEDVELEERTINLEYGETKSDTQTGSFPGTYTTDDPSIATVSVEVTQGVATPATDPTTTKVTSITSGNEYILGNGTQWITLDANGNIGSTTNAAEATKFTVTRNSEGTYTISAQGFALSLATNTTYNAATVSYAAMYNNRATTTYYYRDNNNIYYPITVTRSGSGGNRKYTLRYTNQNGQTVTLVNAQSSTTTGNYYTATTAYQLEAKTTGTNWTFNSTSGFTSSNRFIGYNNGWTLLSSANSSAFPYTYTEGTPAVPGGDITTATFTAVNPGTTYVTIGNVHYTINVAPEDLSKVTPLTYYPFIADFAVSPEGTGASNCNGTEGVGNPQYLAATVDGVNSENGIKVSDFAWALGDWRWEGDSTTTKLWKGVVHAGDADKQVGTKLDLSTTGTDFYYVRYYNGSWAVSADRVSWTTVDTANDEVCVYYMQETDLTEEVTIYVKDWAFTTNDYSSYGSDSRGHKALSFSVVYPDGQMSPSEDDIYSETTLIYWYNTGSTSATDSMLIRAGVNSIYEIEKVTYTFGTIATESASGGSFSWNKVTVDGVEWYDETVYNTTYDGGDVAVRTSDFCALGTGLFESSGQAVLLLIYLKPVETEDSLKVVYQDDSANAEIMSYALNIKNESTAEAGTFVNRLVQTSAVQTGNITLDDNAYVVNYVGKNETFEKELTKIPSLMGKYASGLYYYTGADISADGKTLTLHYNLDESKLERTYVLDFGLPVQVSVSSLTEGNVKSVAIAKNGNLGTATATTSVITYTPAKVLTGTDTIRATVTYQDNSTEAFTIGFIPATTVYYEEGFATYTGSWSSSNKGTGTQTASIGYTTDRTTKTLAVYGYDAAYNAVGASNGTQATSSTKGDCAEFTFVGTGVDIYMTTASGSGSAVIAIENESGSVFKLATVYTAATNGETDATANQAVTSYGSPVYSITGLARDTYTVSIYHVLNLDKSCTALNFDGFRVHGTLATDNQVYKNDLEDNPSYIELRDQVLTGFSVENDGSSEQTYGTPFGGDGTGTTVAIVTNVATLSADTVSDLLTNGPKNELYLQPGQAVTFSVSTSRKVEVGMHAVNAAATCTVNSNTVNLNSSVDMFYAVTPGTNGQIVITNTGSGVLGITKIKVCDEIQLNTLTQADIDAAVAVLMAPAVEEEKPAVEEKPTEEQKPATEEKPKEDKKPAKEQKPKAEKPVVKPGKPNKPVAAPKNNVAAKATGFATKAFGLLNNVVRF